MSYPTIEKYYDKTRFDYRYVWNSRNTHAIHFGYYDENATKHKDAVSNMNRVLADLAHIKSTDFVLDAGCGVGGSSLWLAKERDCDVLGVVMVESQYKDAVQNADKMGLTHKVKFEKADYCDTPFENETFDVVWALESQCHALHKQDFYKEAYRLLKKGGRLVIADYVRAKRPFDTEGDEKLLKDWLNKWAIMDIDTEEEHKKNADNEGFKNMHFSNVNPHVRRSLLNAYEHSEKWLGLAKVLNNLRIVSDVQVGNVTGTISQFKAWDKGLWYYAIWVSEKL